MSDVSKIEITIEEDRIQFSTNLSIVELNFWLDQVKYLIVTGQAQASEQE